MVSMGALLSSLADLVRRFAAEVLGEQPAGATAGAVDIVLERRKPCARAAHRRTQVGLDDAEGEADGRKVEWMSYTALLVQADRIVDDLAAPLPN